MKTILQDPTTRIWCLSGLTGIVLMAGVLLEEGQARTYSPSPVNSSIQVNTLNLPTPSSQSMNTKKSETLKAIPKQKANVPAMQKDVEDKGPAKKRMGLAILFLGILAKEG